MGQDLDTLSGGESQRLVMATELMKPSGGTHLYLLEEPSTGLHFRDIEFLNALFRKLVRMGHTVMVIEHDPDIILQADHIIDLGPEGGDRGGSLVAQGTLEAILENESSRTGKYLEQMIASSLRYSQ
jgi:excinuclease ABC subunit A